jgi:hypothetical protein
MAIFIVIDPVELQPFLVLWINDSEFSGFTSPKPIQCHGCIYLVSPGALRAPTPPRPPLWGREVTKKENITTSKKKNWKKKANICWAKSPGTPPLNNCAISDRK